MKRAVRVARHVPGISYERAAASYDAARVTPPAAEARAFDALIAALSLQPGDRLLEACVGTGRVAAPLGVRSGARIIGVDLSRAMMRRAREKGVRDLVAGDASRLPLRDGAVKAALFVHALHVIPSWQEALREARRVTHRGPIVVSTGGLDDEDAPQALLREELRRVGSLAGIPALDHPGARRIHDITAAMEDLGYVRERVVGARWHGAWSPQRFIEGVERGAFSSTWDWPPSFRERAIADLRSFAVARWGSVDAELGEDVSIMWDVFRHAEDS